LIIDLDPDYQWAVVGDPTRPVLWILSRTPTMDAAVYEDILSRLPEKNYYAEQLVVTPQDAGSNIGSNRICKSRLTALL